jgi:hypothetical protein
MSFEISQGLNNECNFLVAVIKTRENYVVRNLILVLFTRNQVKEGGRRRHITLMMMLKYSYHVLV